MTEISADDAARAQTLLAGLRSDIDNLDAVLVYTLAQRFKATKAVGVLKAAHSLPPSDPAREDCQIARLHALCEDSGLDPIFAKKVLNFIIQEVIRHHEQMQT